MEEAKEWSSRDVGNGQTGTGSVRLTSVPVGGLVEHEHGIINLGETNNSFLTWRSLSCHATYCLTSALLKFCREVQQQMDRREGEEGDREGGDGRQATGYREEPEGAETEKYEEILYVGN